MRKEGVDKWGRGRFDEGPFREDILADIINLFKFQQVVELGVFDGYTAMTILEKCPQVQYFGVDKWAHPDTYQCLAPRGEESRRVYGVVDMPALYQLTLKNIEPYKDRATLILETTLEASNKFENNSIDLVFIDADHSYEGVKADILAWAPKVKMGGIVSGHDFSWVGVRKAIEECLSINQITTFTDDVWVFKKS